MFCVTLKGNEIFKMSLEVNLWYFRLDIFCILLNQTNPSNYQVKESFGFYV